MKNSTLARSGRTNARITALLAIPVMVAILTGCAGGGTPTASPGNEMTFDDWQLANAQCMRDEGIDMPDPTEDGRSMAIDTENMDMEALEAASKKCISKLGEPPAPEGGFMSEDDMRESMLKMAKCFRDNGLDVPDPKSGEGFSLPADAPSEVMEKCGLEGGANAVTVNPGN
jgi:hypothetical protein